jgi:hypothetical protein
MERLPYIDEHSRTIGATPVRVWSALIATWHGHAKRFPAALTRPWGLVPSSAHGDWRSSPRPGDSVPGFSVARCEPPFLLELRGRHRFSSYALVFELTAVGEGCCRLSARSWAEFPRLPGRAYRALVIGSGGHRVVVARLLREIAARS